MGLSYWGLIYIKQSGEYPALNESSASVFSFFPNAYGTEAQVLSVAGILIAGLVALTIMVVMYRSREMTNQKLFLLSVMGALFIPYFLPHMHERYFYLADVLSTLYALYYPRHWYLPVLIVAASFFSYMPYLSSVVPLFKVWQVDLRIPSFFFAIAGAFIIALLIKIQLVERASAAI